MATNLNMCRHLSGQLLTISEPSGTTGKFPSTCPVINENTNETISVPGQGGYTPNLGEWTSNQVYIRRSPSGQLLMTAGTDVTIEKLPETCPVICEGTDEQSDIVTDDHHG